jgi:L-ascorbate metabolism protein UlaG (beta-lactamase superfamily)
VIQPALQDDAFLASIAAGRRRRDEALRVWWLGQSGFLVQWQGRHLLLDPYLSDSLTAKYAATDKPHVRMTAWVIAPGRLDFIDVATSSHCHTDHLDAETLVPLMRANPAMKLVAPAAVLDFVAKRLGTDPAFPVGLSVGQSVTISGFTLTAVPAAHEELSPEFLGYIVQAGPFTIYHSGDTILYDGMADRLRHFHVHLALLPINGRAPERRVAGNLDGPEAAQLAHDIGAKVVVPCHYEMFEFNSASPDEFLHTCAELHQTCRALRAGECLEMNSTPSPGCS